MSQKEFKTYRQLLTILRSRGMTIGKGSQGSRVMRILEQENYYNIINGYKTPFLSSVATATTDEAYMTGTTFDEIYALYCFDREIRGIYLRYLLKAENTLKTVISHEFSALYGHDNYLKMDNFQTVASTDPQDLNYIARKNQLKLPADMARVQRISRETNIENVTKLIGDIQQEISRQMSKHHEAVTHYMTQHGYIPLWVLVNILTFGKITAFYYNMKPTDRRKIATSFGLPERELHKLMDMLSIARNKCAHDERFYNIRFRKGLRTNSIKHYDALAIPSNPGGSSAYGTQDAYAIAIILTLILNKTDIKSFITSMNAAFDKLSKQLHTISVDRIMMTMGFGPTWKNLPLLKP
ncbi:MAG: Abi family protein [Aristaeellaceae bacterium]